jgi:hypothetical protein
MLKTVISSALIAGAMALSALSSAQAAPVIGVDLAPQALANHALTDVQFIYRNGGGYFDERTGATHSNPDPDLLIRRGYLNGHRGWRERRHGYRYHDGYWYPPAAFALGVIIGNGGIVIEKKTRRYRRSNGLSGQHYAWCEGRYKTYRSWDNTYIPRKGYRAECHSPYWP